MFALTLEDITPNSVEQTSRLMLHGDAQNRWWDKSFNLIVAPNGSAAISWEHAWGDGVAVLNFFNTVCCARARSGCVAGSFTVAPCGVGV
jgi:carnitine O-palmitoyltransferase 2